MPFRHRFFRPLLGVGAVLLLGFAGCETTQVSRSDVSVSVYTADKPFVSTKLQLRLIPREGVLVFSPDGDTITPANGILTNGLVLDPAGATTVFALPLPDDRVSVEAIAVGYGRMLQNGFAEQPGVRAKTRGDLDFPAREYRWSTTNNEGKPIDIYYTALKLPGRAVLVAEQYSSDFDKIRDRDPATRIPFRIEDLGGDLSGAEAKAPLPEYAYFINGMGLYYADHGNTGRALDYFAQAWDRYPELADFLFNYGMVAMNRSEPERVVDKLEPAVEQFPDDMRLPHLLANAYVQSGRETEGIALFEKMLADGVEDPELLGNYFGSLDQQGNYERLVEVAAPYLDSDYADLARIWTAVAWRDSGDLEKAWSTIEPHLEAMLDAPDTLGFVINLALQRNEYAEALTYADEALERTGNQEYEFYRGLALLNLGQFAASREAFETTVAANPGNADARSLLSQVINLLGQNDPSLYATPIEAVALIPELENYAHANSPEYLAKTGALGHLMGEAVHWEPGAPYRCTRYMNFEVRDRDALARLKETVIPFDPLAERVYVNSLKVYDADGNLVAEGNPSQYYLSDPQEDSVIDTRKSLHLPIPGLLVGGSYELTVTTEYQGNADTLYFTDYCFSGPHPRELSFFQFTGATDRVAVQTNDPSIHPLEADGALAWVCEEPAVYENQPLLPLYTRYLPTVWIADAKDTSWADLARKYAEDLDSVLGETPENIATEARSLDLGDGSPEAIVKAVSDLLTERYTYTALNFGRHATQPHDPAEICRNRFGDCKDFTVAMYHYLKALGVESHPVLVRSGRGLVEALPSLDQFDHMILHVPALSEHPLVDPSDTHMAIGQTPRSTLGEPVLLVSGESDGLLPASGTSPEDNHIVIDRSLAIGDDGAVEANETVVFRGFVAAYLRDMLTPLDPDEHLQQIQDFFLQSGISMDLLDFSSSNLNEMNEPLQVAMRYRRPRALFETGQSLVGQLAASWDYLTFHHQRSERPRSQPVEIYHPILVEVETAVSWPDSMQLSSDLQKLDHSTTSEFGHLVTNLENQGSTQFTFSTRATIRHNTYAAEAYKPVSDYFDTVCLALTPTLRLATAPQE